MCHLDFSLIERSLRLFRLRFAGLTGGVFTSRVSASSKVSECKVMGASFFRILTTLFHIGVVAILNGTIGIMAEAKAGVILPSVTVAVGNVHSNLDSTVHLHVCLNFLGRNTRFGEDCIEFPYLVRWYGRKCDIAMQGAGLKESSPDFHKFASLKLVRGRLAVVSQVPIPDYLFPSGVICGPYHCVGQPHIGSLVSTEGVSRILERLLCDASRSYCRIRTYGSFFIRSEHRAPLERSNSGVKENTYYGQNFQSYFYLLAAILLLVLSCKLIYYGLWNLHYGAQDWRAVASIVIAWFPFAAGLYLLFFRYFGICFLMP